MGDFTTEAFTLLAIGIVLILLRTYARITTVGFRGLKPDDYIMLLAMVSNRFLPLLPLSLCLHASFLSLCSSLLHLSPESSLSSKSPIASPSPSPARRFTIGIGSVRPRNRRCLLRRRAFPRPRQQRDDRSRAPDSRPYERRICTPSWREQIANCGVEFVYVVVVAVEVGDEYFLYSFDVG
jgi:hypothetical protein